MKDQNLDLFDPRTAVTDPKCSPIRIREPDFAFAFNESNFSDRVLRIEILGDSIDGASDSNGCNSLADWARNRKRRREDFRKENALDITACPEEQIISCNQIDSEDVDNENQDESVVAMIEEPNSEETKELDYLNQFPAVPAWKEKTEE